MSIEISCTHGIHAFDRHSLRPSYSDRTQSFCVSIVLCENIGSKYLCFTFDSMKKKLGIHTCIYIMGVFLC